MNYTDVKTPIYADANNTSIRCQVKFDAYQDYLPFIASNSDPVAHGQEIFADLVAGKYGAIGAYVEVQPTPYQLYKAAIASGLAVTSASTPALNATYGVADADTANIGAEAQFISTYQEFTNGLTTFPWADATGIVHTFPSTTVFMQFSKAAAQYVSACKQVFIAQSGGGAVQFPSNQITIV